MPRFQIYGILSFYGGKMRISLLTPFRPGYYILYLREFERRAEINHPFPKLKLQDTDPFNMFPTQLYTLKTLRFQLEPREKVNTLSLPSNKKGSMGFFNPIKTPAWDCYRDLFLSRITRAKNKMEMLGF